MDLEVQPEKWILPNRIGFGSYVYNTFHPSKYPLNVVKKSGCECNESTCDIPSDVISLFPHQRIVKDFIQINSPYKGLLLYHELGSGKSAASIAASEGYIGKKKVFIMTPASLVQNYVNELLKMSKIGLNMKKSWTLLKVKRTSTNAQKILLDKYSISSKFVKSNGLVWIPLYENDIPDAEIIKDNIRYSKLDTDEKTKIDDTMVEIINNRYTFISYNGLTQSLVNKLSKEGFDNSFIVIDEVHNFISRVVNGSKLARNLYNKMISASNNKIVLLSGTPIINNPYEISTLINLIRGYMNVYKLNLLKKSENPTDDAMINRLIQDDLFKYVDNISFINNKKYISVTLLTEGFVRNNNDDIDIIKKEWKMSDKKIIEDVISSLNNIPNIGISKLYKTENKVALPSKKEEFNDMFINLLDEENPTVKNMDIFRRRILGTLSYFKTSGTEYFPKVFPTNIKYLDMTDEQLSKYAEVRDEERMIDDANKRNNRKGNGAKRDMMAEKTSVYRAFSRMVCNFSFPKEIKRSYPNNIRKLLRAELNINNDDDDEDTNDKDDDIKRKEELKKIKETYDKELTVALKDLEEKDYLSLENLRQKYSPKYAEMFNDIETSPGTVLVYSQFRNVEGLGIFSKVLEKQGYKEITVRKTTNGYEFEDMTVFDKIYDNKRFVIFNSDRTKTNILMNLFNGSYNLLPDSIKQQLKDQQDQLYGKLVKVMMITQSGAEGISLKNVRRVLIMEYYWNAVRINQVIGRAVRTCSHEMLPVEHRNVEIFAYIMKLTKKQLEKDFTIRRLDNGMTTDQHILDIATKKENIINAFLTMLKSTSFDCIINSLQNEPLKNGYRCYNWPINVNTKELSYTNDIDMDNMILKYKKRQVEKRNRGKVVSRNGIKYVLLDGKLYDYFSYKNSGILLKI